MTIQSVWTTGTSRAFHAVQHPMLQVLTRVPLSKMPLLAKKQLTNLKLEAGRLERFVVSVYLRNK
jgi:hypothetical protein